MKMINENGSFRRNLLFQGSLICTAFLAAPFWMPYLNIKLLIRYKVIIGLLWCAIFGYIYYKKLINHGGLEGLYRRIMLLISVSVILASYDGWIIYRSFVVTRTFEKLESANREYNSGKKEEMELEEYLFRIERIGEDIRISDLRLEVRLFTESMESQVKARKDFDFGALKVAEKQTSTAVEKMAALRSQYE